jgi:pilus assembly protein FimV
MSSGKNPLVLMMALSMPGAAQALGLGDIHVDSGLNERLVAEIDIVGATALELTDLRAAVANREVFLRYGADRPAFLSSTAFKVTQDSHGHPVLAVRSTESFTEPVVNFLVDLNWRNGELVRQYTLLLDPSEFTAAQHTAPVPAIATTPAVGAAPAVAGAPAIAAAPAVAATPAAAPSAVAASEVSALPAPAAPRVEAKTQTAVRSAAPSGDQFKPAGAELAVRKMTHIKVGAKATLRGVAWRAGERSESDLQRMMIAIFRANPNAFDGNINRLHRGAVLTIPSRAELAAISKADAMREFHAQMQAWHAPARAVAAAGEIPATPTGATHTSATPAAEPPAAVTAATLPTDTKSEAKTAAAPADEALGHRIQSLEQELDEMKGLLESQHDQLLGMQQQASRVQKAASAATAASAPGVPLPEQKAGIAAIVPFAAGLGTLAAALAALYFRFRRRAPAVRDVHAGANPANADVMVGTDSNAAPDSSQDPADSAPALLRAEEPAHATPSADTSPFAEILPSARAPAQAQAQVAVSAISPLQDDEATHPALPILSSVKRPGPTDATVNLHVDTVNLRMDPLRLDYNLLDLDLTAQHVQMPSVLNEHVVVKERRTNLADVLKLAIEREPDRHDLRMKLLELYYAAAATNRQAFLEVVQKFSRDRDYLQPEQWNKVAFMGRQIAAENPMFAEDSADDDDLADCA